MLCDNTEQEEISKRNLQSAAAAARREKRRCVMRQYGQDEERYRNT
jgi:hypothetical protein